MHGSSSVPQDPATINQYGGKMKETPYSVPVEEIQKAIQFGVRRSTLTPTSGYDRRRAGKFLAENLSGVAKCAYKCCARGCAPCMFASAVKY
jgi:fructose-bisphosphate aldolase class II